MFMHQESIMAKIGKFINKHMKGEKVQLYIGDEMDWFKYADNESMSYVLIVCTLKDYDEECGVITAISENGQEFYISEDKIEMFWKHGSKFNIMETSTSTVRSGKRRLKGERDIM